MSPEMREPATWEHMRAVVLHRDAYICQICGAPANEVDHVWPRALGGQMVLRNLQAACGPCNRTKGCSVHWLSATREQVAWALTADEQRRVMLDAEISYARTVLGSAQ